MSRPRWFPPLRPETEGVDAQAILQCQGNWWAWGGSICRKPEICVAQMACYFVAQAAKHVRSWDAIHWSTGFDPEPQTISMFEAA